MSLSGEILLRSGSLLRALLKESPPYRYNMKPSGKLYEILIEAMYIIIMI